MPHNTKNYINFKTSSYLLLYNKSNQIPTNFLITIIHVAKLFCIIDTCNVIVLDIYLQCYYLWITLYYVESSLVLIVWKYRVSSSKKVVESVFYVVVFVLLCWPPPPPHCDFGMMNHAGIKALIHINVLNYSEWQLTPYFSWYFFPCDTKTIETNGVQELINVILQYTLNGQVYSTIVCMLNIMMYPWHKKIKVFLCCIYTKNIFLYDLFFCF